MKFKPAVITTIENSQTNIGQGGKDGKPSPLEEDAAECFYAWRKRGGKLKDIPFYCICPSKKYPKQKTKDIMKENDIIYIEEYMPKVEEFTCGFWNVIEVGKWCENNLEEDLFIHIDLDMNLIKEPPIDLFAFDSEKYIAKIGIINETFWARDINPDYKTNFETCFVNSWKNSGFYHIWYDELVKYIETNFPGMKDEEIPHFDELEEHIIDVMYNENLYPIQPIEVFQMGFYYPIDNLKDEDILNIYFHHDHYYEQKHRLHLKYLRRLRNVRSAADHS
jgi:hypothetical protein